MTSDEIVSFRDHEAHIPLFLREIAFQLSRANDMREEQWEWNRQMDEKEQADHFAHRSDSTNAIVNTMKEAFNQMMGGFAAPKPAPATPELLVEVSEHRDRLQHQLDVTIASLGEMPKPQAAMVEVGLIPSIKAQIKDAEFCIAKIQHELEHPTPIQTPTFVFIVSRPAPEHGPNQCEIAEHEDGTLKVWATESLAKAAARELGGDWASGSLLLQPQPAAALPDARTESSANPNQKESL